jgi:hypothetical protein
LLVPSSSDTPDGTPHEVAAVGRRTENPGVIPQERLAEMAQVLVGLSGIEAVVLGGSRARGTGHAGSDVDLGLYYDRERFDADALTGAAERFTGSSQVDVNRPGGWGPWVDGGAWLTVDGTRVDWILRDVRRVREQCERAARGEYAFHAQPGHPLGFLDVSYAGEVATCRPLADPDGVVEELRTLVDPYPAALREALVGNVWQAGFLVDAAGKGIPRGDITYVTLCCSTALMLCAHAWHAAAGSWATNEKGLVVDVDRLGLDTGSFAARVGRALTVEGTERRHLERVVHGVRGLVDDTVRALQPRP